MTLWLEALMGQMSEGTLLAPLGGLLVGIVLTLSPLSLPGIAASVATFSPGRFASDGTRTRWPLRDSVPVVIAFVAGMDAVLAVLGYVFVEVTIALTRASVAMHLLAASLLGFASVRLLSGRHSLCGRAQAIPPTPLRAFGFGMLFSVTGCIGCGPIVIGLASATALLAGPMSAVLALTAFILGRSAVLLAVGGLGFRLATADSERAKWRRLDLVAGVLFLLAAVYYAYRVASGEVTTLIPGEPGSGVLPG